MAETKQEMTDRIYKRLKAKVATCIKVGTLMHPEDSPPTSADRMIMLLTVLMEEVAIIICEVELLKEALSNVCTVQTKKKSPSLTPRGQYPDTESMVPRSEGRA